MQAAVFPPLVNQVSLLSRLDLCGHRRYRDAKLVYEPEISLRFERANLWMHIFVDGLSIIISCCRIEKKVSISVSVLIGQITDHT